MKCLEFTIFVQVELSLNLTYYVFTNNKAQMILVLIS